MTTTIDIIDTRVPGTSAAHMHVTANNNSSQWITVVWSTGPVACDNYELGDIAHGKPIRYAVDEPPPVWDAGGVGNWQPNSNTQCRTCGTYYGPRVVVLDGKLQGRELAAEALYVARDAVYDRIRVARRIAKDLIDRLDIVATELANGRPLDEVPVASHGVEPPAVIREGDQLVAFHHLGDDDSAMVEVRWPLPTPLPEMVDDLGPFEDGEDDEDDDEI